MKEPLDLNEMLVIHTSDDKDVTFEVVGLIEGQEKTDRYAVLYSEAEDEFVVTDSMGNLLKDAELAQEVLDDFFELSDEPSGNGRAN